MSRHDSQIHIYIERGREREGVGGVGNGGGGQRERLSCFCPARVGPKKRLINCGNTDIRVWIYDGSWVV